MTAQGAERKTLGPPSWAALFFLLRRGRRRELRVRSSGRRPGRPCLFSCAEDGAGSREKEARAAVLGGPVFSPAPRTAQGAESKKLGPPSWAALSFLLRRGRRREQRERSSGRRPGRPCLFSCAEDGAGSGE